MKTQTRSTMVRSILAFGAAGVLMAATATALAAGAGPPKVKLTALPVPTGTLSLLYSDVLSPNGKTLYVSGSEGVDAVNLAEPSAAPVPITSGGAPVAGAVDLALAPNGRTLYIAGDVSGTTGVYVADVGGPKSGKANNTVVAQISDPHSYLDMPTGLAVSGNGKTLYIGNTNNLSGTASDQKATIAVADLSSPTTGTVVSKGTQTHLELANSLSWNPSRKLLYASNYPSPVTVLSASGNTVKTLTTLPGTVNAFDVASSPDGRTLYADVLDEVGSKIEGSAIYTFAFADGGRKANLRQTTQVSPGHIVTGLSLNADGRTGYVALTKYNASNVALSVGGVGVYAVPAAVSKVTVSGQAKVGATLTAKVKGAAGRSDTYKWSASGKPLKRATRSKLKLDRSLVGKKLTVTVTAAAVGYSMKTVTSRPSGKVSN
jgi:hypothetical protein